MAKSMCRFLSFIIGLGLVLASFTVFSATQEPLPIDSAFKIAIKVKDPETIVIQWQMAPGYYLYRDHILAKSDTNNVQLGDPLFPTSVKKTEPEIGTFEVYLDKISLPIPVLNHHHNQFKIKVHYQGCSEAGFCYPPTDKVLSVDLSKIDGNLTLPSTTVDKQPIAKAIDTNPALPDIKELTSPSSEQDKVTRLLGSGHILSIILSFLGFGILLAFTPCVLPMVPILSGIIVGQNREKLTTKRAFSLSMIYVLSMSFTYAIAGILIGYAGGSIQAAFQAPWMLMTFSIMFVALALSFFGLYEIKLPERLQTSLSNASHRQKSGSYLGVAVMGCLATLIVSPCVTPALVGALGYIGKTGNALLGGSALFALGFGMGMPLLLIGTAGGKFLPKAGIWMNRVKIFFGFILLAMAIYMSERILPAPVILFLYACLLIFMATYMGIFSASTASPLSRLNHGLAAIFLVYGVLLLIGAAMGHGNPLQPLYSISESSSMISAENRSMFKHVANEKEINEAIQEAVHNNKIVMLDFTAKWCTSCKLMEHRTFNNPEVTKALGNFIALKADVTENDKIAKKLQHKYQVVAPPTLLFFDSNGHELEKMRIVGEMGPKEFLEHLQTVTKAGQ